MAVTGATVGSVQQGVITNPSALHLSLLAPIVFVRARCLALGGRRGLLAEDAAFLGSSSEDIRLIAEGRPDELHDAP